MNGTHARRSPHGKRFRRNVSLYVMIAPVAVYFLIFNYWPMYGILGAFEDYFPVMGVLRSPWVGFANFRSFFSSFYFWRFFSNTVGMSLYYILVMIPAPVMLALMFDEVRGKKLRGAIQMASYAPNFLSVTVLCSMVLFFLRQDSGTVNAVIRLLGGKPVNFIAMPGAFWNIYVWSGVWQMVGWSSIIYTAAIFGIDRELYEAAELDGAGKLAKIAHITIPCILPTIVIINILNLGNVMNVGYEKVLLLQNSLNLPASEIIATYIYRRGILGASYGFATAVGVFNNVINLAMLLGANWLSKRLGVSGLW